MNELNNHKANTLDDIINNNYYTNNIIEYIF